MRRSLIALLALALIPAVAGAASVTLTASPTTGISPLTVTLNWSASPDLTACTASGAWSGAKTPSGSQVVTGIVANTTFQLSCTGPVGDVTVRWTPPTTNTDGSPISATAPGALAGFELFHASTSAGVATATPIVVPSPTTTSYVFKGLPVGPRYWAAKAFNTEGVRSDLSGQVTSTLVQPSANASAAVTVSVKPNPPVMGTVATQAYEVSFNAWGPKLGRLIGTVPLGAPCGTEPLVYTEGGEYFEVTNVTLSKPSKSGPYVARCEVTS